ncbi:hypothetical protein [Peribacillus butanolivorans]|uniref:hypothetical protein n=1 Tax=Peribacillus butanolivorans TaxID=421767 RepID=UPI003666FD24
MTKRFRISKTKVEEANKQLKKAKLLKIVKHKLEPTHEYVDDELQYDRFNNHYFVADILHQNYKLSLSTLHAEVAFKNAEMRYS